MRKSPWIILLAFVASASARQIEIWSYDRLFKEADLVLIASAQATVETDDHTKDDRWKRSLVGQKTTFTVQSVLKGQVDDGSVAVIHFKLRDGLQSSNGPMLVHFRTKGIVIHGNGPIKFEALLGPPQYLLFLKATDDGCFEPVSGQIDPILSVKEIYSPLPSVIDAEPGKPATVQQPDKTVTTTFTVYGHYPALRPTTQP